MKVEIEARPLSTSEPFVLDEASISVAGAIASIVSCVLGICQLGKQLKRVERKEQESSIEEALRQIGDGTLERMDSIRVRHSVALRDAHGFCVTLRDVRAARFVNVTVRNLREILRGAWCI